ncbi:hypothetical protein J2X14_002586 [Pantoea alhagi]|uniref:hypothetical protein n=1 Tax=Mixta sp. BE291 TaxID=3158787 RepID=UPI00285B8A2F|nr:hypothetical protein [Pantoea alhagi]
MNKQQLTEHIAALEGHAPTFELQVCRELLACMERIAALEQQLAKPIRLPWCSSSPVCEIEAGYANGVNDCKEAIRRAGYPLEGDE